LLDEYDVLSKRFIMTTQLPTPATGFKRIEFIAKEFECNWTYLRHIEELRVKLLQIYLTVYGAVLAVAAFLIKPSEASANTHVDLITAQWPWLGALFLTLFVYGFAVTVFQARQKAGYEHYRKVNAAIRALLGKRLQARLAWETPSNRESGSSRNGHLSAFFWWQFSMACINSSALFLGLGAVFVGNKVSAPHAVTWSLYGFIVALSLQSYFYWRMSRDLRRSNSIAQPISQQDAAR